MPVAHGRVGDQKLLLVLHPLGNALGALGQQDVARALGRCLGVQRGWLGGLGVRRRARAIFGFGMPVHRDVRDIGQDLGRAVLARRKVEQFRRLVDEFRVVFVVQERRVFQQVFHERNVRRHAADTEFTQGAVHTGNRRLGRLGPCRHLFQQAVVIACDHRARIGRAAIQTDAHAGRAAIGGDAAVIGDKVVQRVLGRHAALQGVPVQLHVILACDTCRLDKGLALGDQDLRAHDVDAGDFFGDGVFHLNAGVHLDEVKLARFHIHQEFDGARAFIVHLFGDAFAEVTQLFALGGGQIGGGGAFDHLLVAALNRAIAFPQVIDIASLIAKDLHLDVAGAHDHLFQIALAVAECGLGLTATFADFFLKLIRVHDRTHAATTAAPRGLEHQWKADLGRLFADRVEIIAQNLGRGDDRNAGLDRDLTRAGLVAKGAHGFGLGADKGDSVRRTGIHELGVLGQQAIARMDRIRAAFFGHADDLGNRQIGLNGAKALTDAIGLIRLKSVQRQLILFGVNGDGAFSHLVCGAHDADGDLASVGDQDLFEVCHVGPFRLTGLISRITSCIQVLVFDKTVTQVVPEMLRLRKKKLAYVGNIGRTNL